MADQKINITLAAIDKTKGAFGTISRSIGAVTSAVFSLKTAIVGVVGIGGIGLLVRNSLVATDTLVKTADKLGVTTQALSQLRYAAELSGVGIQTTDMAVQRFTRRLAEAAQGTGEAKGALQELGLNARDLAQQPLEEQMIALSNAFGNVKNSSDQVRLAFKLFDSEGVSFVNILKQGEDGLRAMFEEAGALGVVMSTQAARGVEQANDALFRLSSLFGGVVDQLVAALAPALEEFATSVKDSVVVSIEEANGSIEKFAQFLAQELLGALSATLRGLANFVDGIAQFVNSVIDSINELQRWRGQAEIQRVVLSGLTDAARDAADFVDRLASSIGSASNASQNNSKVLPQQITLLQQVGDAFKKVTAESTTLQSALENSVKRAMDATTAGLTDMITGAKSAKDAFKDMATSIIKDLIRMYVQQQITKPIFNAISGFLPTTAGGSTGKAIGGSVQAGQSYMVGERGPELFVPNRQGSIVPNGGGSGEAPVNVTLNISTGVAQTVRTEIANLLPQITNATKAAVVDARKRGGSFAGAFGA